MGVVFIRFGIALRRDSGTCVYMSEVTQCIHIDTACTANDLAMMYMYFDHDSNMIWSCFEHDVDIRQRWFGHDLGVGVAVRIARRCLAFGKYFGFLRVSRGCTRLATR